MKKVVLLFCLVLLMTLVQGKHLHPRSLVRLETENGKSEKFEADVESVDVPKPNRFVPINSVLFFGMYPPCGEGLKRDLLGLCREVWD